MNFDKYIAYLEKHNYSAKAFIPFLLKINPYLSHEELVREATRCSKLMKLLNPKIRKKVLELAVKKWQKREEIGEFATMFLSALIGSVIGNTIGYLVKEKFEKFAKRVGLV